MFNLVLDKFSFYFYLVQYKLIRLWGQTCTFKEEKKPFCSEDVKTGCFNNCETEINK